MDKILLFIPAYNCEKQILRVLSQIDHKISPFITEIIVVNNRSTDSTEEVVKEYAKNNENLNLKVLRNKSNYNLGGSHKVAFQYAMDNSLDYVIVLHGDDQGNINDILPLLESREYADYDCVLGARFKAGSKLIGYSRFRTFGNYVYNMIFSIALRNKISDLGSGLNMYKVDILKNKFYYRFPDKLTFNYCMIMAADYYKHKIMFFPISWREDDQVSNVKMTSQAVNVLVMLYKYILSRKRFITSDLRDSVVEKYEADDMTKRMV